MGPWFKNWETKPVHSAQCRHVVVCTHQIRRKRTWESLLKTIWDWDSTTVSNMNHTLSNFPSNFIYWLVCQVCCYAGARIILLFFFSVCRAPNLAPMRAFFFPGLPCIRLHQIVLQCTKSCFNACFFFRGFVVHQIVLYGLNNVESPCSCYYFIHALNMEKKCGKTKNWRFCIVFLFGAWARIWPEPGQPPKPRRILNTEY